MKLNPNLRSKFKVKVDRVDETGEVISQEERALAAHLAALDDSIAESVVPTLRPTAVDVRDPDCLEIGGEYCATIYLHSFPQTIEDGWLDDIYLYPYPFELAFYIQPLDGKTTIKYLEKRSGIGEAHQDISATQGMRGNSRKHRQIQQFQRLIQAIEQDQTRPFQVMLAITVRARSREELDIAVKELEKTLPSSAQTRRTRFLQRHGWVSTLPLMRNDLARKQTLRFVHTQALQACFPFTNSEITHETGALIGQSMRTGTPVILNRFLQPPYGNLDNPNMCVIGVSGSGKSYVAKMEMTRWALQGVPVFVIDPMGEYKRLCTALGGQNIKISIDSPDKINPLDFTHAVAPGYNALRDKGRFMIDFLHAMLRSDDGSSMVDPVTRKIFGNALAQAYDKYGYKVGDPDSQAKATPARMPTLSDVQDILQRFQRGDRNPLTQQRIGPLIAALDGFVGYGEQNEGALAGITDCRTTVDLKKPFIVFDISELSQTNKNELGLVMHLILEFLRTTLFNDRFAQTGQKVLLYVDEAQRMMSYAETGAFLGEIARTSRKFGVGLTVLTQNVDTFVYRNDGSGLENQDGIAVLTNCETKLLLKQDPQQERAIRRAFRLTPNEVVALLGGGNGEGILMVGRESVWFTSHGVTPPRLHKLFTSNPRERHEQGEDGDGELGPGDMLALPSGDSDDGLGDSGFDFAD